MARRLIANLLFGAGPADPATMLLAVTILVMVAGVATYVPMWRATHIDLSKPCVTNRRLTVYSLKPEA